MEWCSRTQDEWALGLTTPAVGSVLTPEDCYRLAYQAALQGAGRVKSNPLVGAVLVDKQHAFLGLAWHRAFGEDHAEVALLKQIERAGLTRQLAGATLYCTLEPCAHTGKTPPCSRTLVALPLARVVVAAQDQNPLVNGRGLAELRQAGMDVEVSSAFARQIDGLLEPFFHFNRHHTPFVAAKIACSFDGMIGYVGAQRAWVTNERARRFGHWLRLLCDGIVVGADTIIKDNPRLDVRGVPLGAAQASPAKVVLDPQLRGLQARPLSDLQVRTSGDTPTPLLWVVGQRAYARLSSAEKTTYAEQGIELFPLAHSRVQGFDLSVLVKELGQRGISSLLLEGGRYVWGGFARAHCLHKIYLLQAPQIMGARRSMHWSEGFSSDEAISLTGVSTTPLDDNWLMTATIVEKGATDNASTSDV